MEACTIIPFDPVAHRDEVVALWIMVFGYSEAHNEPGCVIDMKLAVDDGLFFVAVDGGAVVGTVMAGYDGHRGWIYSLAVESRRRKQGIGSELVSHAENALAKRGCLKINLQVMERNSGAKEFYQRLGFATEKRISMGKRLPPVSDS